MKRKKKVLQFFLASALACMAWLAVPGMDARAGDSDDDSQGDQVTVGKTDFSVSNEDGSVSEKVDLNRYSDDWYENNATEFKETVDGVKTTYYETAKFKYTDEDGETQKVKVGIGLTSSGDIATVNSDAWAAVDTTVIDNADSMKDKLLETITGTANCKKSSGCTCASNYDCANKTCAQGGSNGDLFSGGCIGHKWKVKSVGDIETITRGNVTMTARPILVQCEKCQSIETIWLVCTDYHTHNLAVKDNGSNHTHYCTKKPCTYSKTESHKYDSGVTSGYVTTYTCKHCGHQKVEQDIPDLPEGNTENGSAVYTAVYPGGTEHGRQTIKETVTYYTKWVYKYETRTAEEDMTFEGKEIKKGEKYTVCTGSKEVADTDKNKYTVKNKGAMSETSGAFWARFVFDYAPGDESGSTKAVNVPTDETIQYLNYTTDPAVGTVLSYGKNPKLSISVPFDEKTPVTAKDKGSMYRKGYWTDGWTINGGIWNFGETRTTLPGGSPMASGTLTADWIQEQYNVAFDPNTPGNATHRASVSMTSAVETFDTPAILATASLTGWIFDGWYTSPSGGQLISEGMWTYDPYPTVGNEGHPDSITLYAHWTPITYTVVLNGNRPSISIQPLQHFVSSSGLFTWAGSTYTATFTYDSPSDIPVVASMYGMQGWTTTDGWYRVGNPKEPYVAGIAIGYAASYTYYNTSPGMNGSGYGSAKWNLTEENGATVVLYAGWYDDNPDDPTTNTRLPDRVTDQRIKLDANGKKWYATAWEDKLDEDDPYATKTITGADGYEKTWTTKWINEDVTLDLYTQDYGTGVEKAQLIPTRTPSAEATAAIAGWYEVYGTQSDRVYDLTRVLTYNGTTKLYGWSRDYSLAKGLSAGSQKQTVEMTLKIDKKLPVIVSTTRTTGTYDNPLSGDGNPYVGNPDFEDYEYDGATVEDAEMETIFTITVDDRDTDLYNNRDVSGISHVWVEVWDAGNESVIKSYEMELDRSKTAIANMDGDAICYGTYKTSQNLYLDFPDASRLYYRIKVSDRGGNYGTLYDSSDAAAQDVDQNGNPNTDVDDNPGGVPGVSIRNVTIRTWITRNDRSDEASYVRMTTDDDITVLYELEDNYFLGGQMGTLHIDTYGYADRVNVEFPGTGGTATSLTIDGTTDQTTLTQTLLAAWIDQRRGLGTGRLDMLLTFNDGGGHYASTATEKDMRYTTAQSGTTTEETKSTVIGSCQRYYQYVVRIPLYINDVLPQASDWSYDHQHHVMTTFTTKNTVYKDGACGTTKDEDTADYICGTVGDGVDTKLTDTFHTFLYK